MTPGTRTQPGKPKILIEQVMGVFNFVTGFLLGGYTGLYLAKHYNVPDLPDPLQILDQMKKIAEDNKKDK